MQVEMTGDEAKASDLQLLRVNDVAALLRCSRRQIYRLIGAKRMPPPIKIDKLVRWQLSELMAWVNNGCPPFQYGRVPQ
jgi:excisionase family DNA binding protein